MNVIDEKTIIITALAVYLGATFASFFKSVVSDLLMPLLAQVFPIDEAGRIIMTISGKKYDIGRVIVEAIHAVLAIALVLLSLLVIDRWDSVIVAPVAAIMGGFRGKK